MGRRLRRASFERPSLELAPALLGCVLVRALDGVELRARVVETEAYEPHDPASHAFKGRTPRNDVMFGPAGRLYVYFTYGMHHCMNVVADRDGTGSAVLLRAGEPIEGMDRMKELRGTDDPLNLCRGPARWAQAFAVDRRLDGADLVTGDEMWLERGAAPDRVVAGPRKGISVGIELPWRFAVAGTRFVSSPRIEVSRRARSERRRPV